MKLNISYPANGSQKLIEVEDERKLRPFMEKRMGTEVSNPLSPSRKKKSEIDLEMSSKWLTVVVLVLYRSLAIPSAMNSKATFSGSPVETTSKVRITRIECRENWLG